MTRVGFSETKATQLTKGCDSDDPLEDNDKPWHEQERPPWLETQDVCPSS